MDKPKTYVEGCEPKQEHPNPSGTTHQRKRTDPATAHERLRVLRESLKEGEK